MLYKKCWSLFVQLEAEKALSNNHGLDGSTTTATDDSAAHDAVCNSVAQVNSASYSQWNGNE